MEHNKFHVYNLANDLSDDLKAFRTTKSNAAQREAWPAVEGICREACVLAVLLRGSMARYRWEQDAKPARIDDDDLEIIGSLDEETETSRGQVTRVVFGSVVKVLRSDANDEEERLLLRKAEVCTNK